MDGSSGRSAQSVNDVSNNIDKAIDIDVCLWDERLSTVELLIYLVNLMLM